MDMRNENVNDTPAIFAESTHAIETPEDVAERWASKHGAKVSWSETVDGIVEGVVEGVKAFAANAKKRREEED